MTNLFGYGRFFILSTLSQLASNILNKRRPKQRNLPGRKATGFFYFERGDKSMNEEISEYYANLTPYYQRRMNENVCNAIVVFICGVLGLLIIIFAAIVK